MKITLNKSERKRYPLLRIDINDIKQFEILIITVNLNGGRPIKTLQGLLTLKSGETFSDISENCIKSLQVTMTHLSGKSETSEYKEGIRSVQKIIYIL